MVLQLRPMVRGLARRYVRMLPSGIADVSDLEQEAMAGVCKAAKRWSSTGGASWSTYAYRRAAGAIQDYLRSISFGGRYHCHKFTLSSLEELFPYGESLTLGETIACGERPLDERPDPRLREQLDAALRTYLTLEQQSIVTMHCEDGLSLREIGAALGLSESRICQFLRAARERLEVAEVRGMLGV